MVAFSRAAAAVCCSLGAVVALQPIARVRSAARAHAMRPLGSAVENPVAAEDAGPVEVEVVTAVAPAPAAAAAKIPLEEIVDGNWYEGTVHKRNPCLGEGGRSDSKSTRRRHGKFVWRVESRVRDVFLQLVCEVPACLWATKYVR